MNAFNILLTHASKTYVLIKGKRNGVNTVKMFMLRTGKKYICYKLPDCLICSEISLIFNKCTKSDCIIAKVL